MTIEEFANALDEALQTLNWTEYHRLLENEHEEHKIKNLLAYHNYKSKTANEKEKVMSAAWLLDALEQEAEHD